MIFLSIMLFPSMPKGPNILVSLPGPGLVTSRWPLHGGVMLVVKVGRAITFGQKMITGWNFRRSYTIGFCNHCQNLKAFGVSETQL